MILSELLRGVDILASTAGLTTEITGVSYDSRKTKPGDLFVAMTGYETDGHRFIPMALEKGAACVLCQQKPAADVPYVRTSDSRAALAQVGRNWYGDPAAQMTLAGVTGTNGKTTTTYLVQSIVEHAGKRCGVIGTVGVRIGGVREKAERTTPESPDLQLSLIHI